MAGDPFLSAHAAGRDGAEVARELARGLGATPPDATLGFLYLTPEIGHEAGAVCDFLSETTGVPDWVGAVGFGVAGLSADHFGHPAGAALIASLPRESFRVFGPLAEPDDVPADLVTWARARAPALGVVHGDPGSRDIPGIVAGLAEETQAYLVGGLTAGMPAAQIAGRPVGGGLSGVLIASEVVTATGLTQGCTPIGPAHTVTDARENVVATLDGRPALDVLVEDIGPGLARDLGRAGQLVHVALPVPGSDTGDYLVRNLVGLDPDRALVAVGDLVEPGRTLTFCARDPDSAEQDLHRMLADLRERLEGRPRGALYFSCVARGPNLFGPGARELQIVAEGIGPAPLAGFYANGEICNQRLYGYTGVLAVFP